MLGGVWERPRRYCRVRQSINVWQSDQEDMARKTKLTRPPAEVTITQDGKTYTGHYTVESGTVTVSWGFRTITTQIGGSTAVVVARMLLRELTAVDSDEL